MADMKKTLYRIPKEGKIFGVCAGFADYFDIDVTLMRVIFVILAFATGGALVFIYLIIAIILPVSGQNKSDTIDEKIEQLGKDLKVNKSAKRFKNIIGIGLVIIGCWILLDQFVPWMFNFQWKYVWPILLILIGLLMVTRRKNEE